MATYALRCQGCRQPYEGRGDWAITMRGGVVTRVICPDCLNTCGAAPSSPPEGEP